MPNLAMDLIVPALMHIVSVETASKIFLSLVVLMFNVGLHLMGLAANDRPHWSALAGTFFTYNLSFAYGFVNYMFGVGMFFITLALWLRFHPHWTIGRIITISLLALVCYVSHLSSFVFLGISLVCLIGIEIVKTRSIPLAPILGMVPLIGPTVAYTFYSLVSQPRGPMQWWRPVIEMKLKGLFFPFVSYDFVLGLGLGLAFLSLILLSMTLKDLHLVSLQLFLMGCIFMVFYTLAPFSAGGTHFVDRRFLVPGCVLILLGVRIEIRRTLGCGVLTGLIIISVVKNAEVWHYWHRIGQEVQEQVHLLDLLPDGVRLYPMVERNPTRGWLRDMHFFFLAHYATIYRHAFVPTLYAWSGVHPLKIRGAEDNGGNPPNIPAFDQVNWAEVFSKYDYIWVYKLPEESKRFLLSKGEVVSRKNDAFLIRIRKT
jgi:hypothetical protein